MRVSGIFQFAQRTCAGAALLLLPTLAHAQDATTDAVTDSGDTAFVIAMALVALAMILPGVMLHHGARLKARAFAATATEVGAIAAIVTLLWVIVGYTLGFGNVTSGWLGSGNAWMLIDLGNVRGASAVPEIAFVLLQLGFVILAATLLTGAWVERGNLAWVVPFAGLWSLIVYAPVAHWVWGGGWLAARLGTVDFGGALVVHGSVGMSALVLTLLIGRRARPEGFEGSSGLTLAGTGLVWGALLALTAGTTLAASDDAATALVNAQIAAAAGALTWLLADALTGGRTRASKIPGFALARGALAGIVAASAAVNAMAPGAAILAGLTGTLIAWIAARLLRRSGIDDALDLVAVHGIAGLAGAMLAAPLIAGTFGGTGYAPGMGPMRQIVAQAIGAGVVALWAAIGTAIIALMVATVVPMRVSEDEETASSRR